MNFKKNIRLIFLFLLLSPFFAKSQSNYKPGYFINPKGDTIRGYIDYREWNENPKEVKFRKTKESSEVLLLNPNLAKEFQVDAYELYQGVEVRISMDELDPTKMSQAPDTSKIQKTVFLKVLVKGSRFNLYNYTDSIKTRYLVSKPGSFGPLELEFHYLFTQDDAHNLVSERGFRNQILSLTNGDKSLQRRINSSEYRESELIPIFYTLNGDSVSHKFIKNTGNRKFLGIGLNRSVVSIRGDFPLSGSNATLAPEVDAGIDFFFNNQVRKSFFRLEINADYEKYSFGPQSSPLGIVVQYYSLSFNQLNFSLSPKLFWNLYNNEVTKIFLGAGIKINYSIYGNYLGLQDQPLGFPKTTQPNTPNLAKLSFQVPIEAGWNINRHLELHLAYFPATLSSFLTEYINYHFQKETMHAGLNYFFDTKK